MIIVIQAILLFSIAFLFAKRETELHKLFWSALALKVLGGVALGLLYTYYYSVGDTFSYYNDAIVVADHAEENLADYIKFLWSAHSSTLSNLLQIQDVRAQHFTKILSLFALASFRNYWMLSMLLSMISFAGSWFLVKTIWKNLPDTFPAATFAFLFFPSVVFWSSGIIRESISMACLFYLSGIILKIWFGQKLTIGQWILIVLSSWTLWVLKYYFAAVFFAAWATTIIYHLVRKFSGAKPMRYAVLIWFLILIIPTMIISASLPNLYPSRILSVIVENHNAYLPDKASISFYDLSPTFYSFTLNSPVALVSGLFRPFLWEVKSLLEGVLAVENVIVVLLTLAALIFLFKSKLQSQRILLIALLVYTFALAILITLSTPNFGTLSRYRIGYLPFFIYIVCSVQPTVRILERMLRRLVRFRS